MDKINVSIVAYNTSPDLLRAAIDSILLEKEIIHKIYLVDNSETDSLRILEQEYQIDYIHLEENVGFGKAHNVAIRKTLSEQIMFHLVLNPDVYFENGTLTQLFNFMLSMRDCGLVMPKVLYPDGSSQNLCKILPNPAVLFLRRFLSQRFANKLFNSYELSYARMNKPSYVPYLSGCFMLMRTEALKKVGLFDENIFMYLEDTDLSRRIADHYETICYPKVSIFHHYAKGSFKNKKLLKYHIQSAIYYFNKWGWFFDSDRRKKNKKALAQFR